VPEAAPNYGHMRVSEFLAFMARLRQVPKEEVAMSVERVVERLALKEVLRKQARTLSRGYRQRLALAQALVHDPQIVILDEPTNGLDPRQIIEVRELIRALAGDMAILVTSHILVEIERVAHRVAILLDGRLLGVHALADARMGLEELFLSLTEGEPR